jgi:hypothetical protein
LGCQWTPKENIMAKAARKVFIVAKVDPAEKAHVERTAEAEGLSISAVVRRAIKKDRAIQRTPRAGDTC